MGEARRVREAILRRQAEQDARPLTEEDEPVMFARVDYGETVSVKPVRRNSLLAVVAAASLLSLLGSAPPKT